MRSEMLPRLIALVEECDKLSSPKEKATLLLKKGVLLPPCKVGDVVYAASSEFDLPPEIKDRAGDIVHCEVVRFLMYRGNRKLLLKPLFFETYTSWTASKWFSFPDVGKKVFLSEEEAKELLRVGD